MWNSNAWAWMDFEIPGLLQMPDTWELGILGILLEVGNKTRYICVILDENLKNLEEIFPEYSLYNPELDIEFPINFFPYTWYHKKTCYYF